MPDNSAQKDARKLWVEALRSSEYKQGQGKLRVDDAYCCLGVACDLYRNAVGGEWVKEDGGWYYAVGDGRMKDYLPSPVRDWLGLGDNGGRYNLTTQALSSLATLNDRGASFDEIASVIESEPEDLLT